tara:strand:- start:2112 stop:4526 length:2415 start_codon:yes stop_codon:yes gene_type:complete
MSRINNLNQPPQRVPYSKKTKEWRKDNVDAADKHSFYHNESVRQTIRNKVINLNLYNGIVNVKDLTDVVNPYHMDASFVPDNIPHHPICVPKIDLLVGEEIKRRFDWKVVVSNADAVSAKENEKKKALMQKMGEFVQANYPEDELEAKFKELQDYMKYDWQDLREKMANQILRHYSQEQEFDSLFNDGFKDALILAEEIYQIDIVHKEPVLTKLNPLKVHSVRSGNSSKIEDSSVIIIEDHWSPGRIVDHYHDQLKPKDIDYILDYSTTKTSGGSYSDDQNNHTLLRDSLEATQMSDMYDNIFSLAEINGHYFGSDYTDENGNIRVFRVYWRSLKKIQKVKYYDEYGETQYKIRSEEYKVNQFLGEESTPLWVNEWWEGTKIGKDIYLQMQPRPVQFNKLNNPSYCHPGIIGQIYNTNQGKAVSLMDRMKNYQYMYDVIWDRLNKAIATNYGKIFEMDLAKVPANWEIEKWLHFAVVNKIAVIDSFKEGTQGAATGKLAGGMNTQGGRAIDLETGAYIQQHIQLLEFIKMEMSEIAGVTKQREGAIHQNETASGVERSVNQSSHITEFWFATHEAVKIRCLTAFLETAKVALKGDNKKVQYILDDQSIQMLNIDGNEFNEADYGIVCTSSTKAMELEQLLKQNSQALMQNGGSMSSIIDIFFSPSLSDMRRKLEITEEEMFARQNQGQEQANKLQQQAQEQAMQLEQAKMQLDDGKNIRDNETKIYIADLKAQTDMLAGDDTDGDGIVDPLNREKLDLDKDKARKDHLVKMKKLSQDMVQHDDKMVREDKKIAVARSKPKPTSK